MWRTSVLAVVFREEAQQDWWGSLARSKVECPKDGNSFFSPQPQPRKAGTHHKMKILTLNFLTCAVKACKSSAASYPLHPKDAELVQDESEVNPQLLINVLPRLDWSALRTTSTEVRRSLPPLHIPLDHDSGFIPRCPSPLYYYG